MADRPAADAPIAGQPPREPDPPLDVVAVGAHPDDVEIGCGGTLARLVEQGYRVGIIDLTDGEPTPASPGPEVRLAEAAKAAEILGVAVRVTLPLENRRLMDTYESRVALAKVFRRLRPRLVIGLAGATPLASPDHLEARKLIDAGVFYSRLTKWDEHFDGLPVHRIESQLYYSLQFYSLEPPTDGNRFIADISTTLGKKLASIAAYETQFGRGEVVASAMPRPPGKSSLPEKQSIFARVETMARAMGSAAGFEAGESLSSPRVIGAQDVMKQVF